MKGITCRPSLPANACLSIRHDRTSYFACLPLFGRYRSYLHFHDRNFPLRISLRSFCPFLRLFSPSISSFNFRPNNQSLLPYAQHPSPLMNLSFDNRHSILKTMMKGRTRSSIFKCVAAALTHPFPNWVVTARFLESWGVQRVWGVGVSMPVSGVGCSRDTEIGETWRSGGVG